MSFRTDAEQDEIKALFLPRCVKLAGAEAAGAPLLVLGDGTTQPSRGALRNEMRGKLGMTPLLTAGRDAGLVLARPVEGRLLELGLRRSHARAGVLTCLRA